MKRLIGFAFNCVLLFLIFVMLTADFFHRIDGGQGWWEVMDDF